MLFFTYPMDLSPEVKRLLAGRLEEETGQKCIILDLNCTGAYYAPDFPKETTDRGAAHPPGQDKDVPQHDSPMTADKGSETRTPQVAGRGQQRSK